MYIGFVSVVKAEVFSSFFKNGYFRYCHTGVLLGFFKKWKLDIAVILLRYKLLRWIFFGEFRKHHAVK